MLRRALRILVVCMLVMTVLMCALSPLRSFGIVLDKGWLRVGPWGIGVQHWIGHSSPELQYDVSHARLRQYFLLPKLQWYSNWQDLTMPWWMLILLNVGFTLLVFRLTRIHRIGHAFPVDASSKQA
jgi:hypothetical protein